MRRFVLPVVLLVVVAACGDDDAGSAPTSTAAPATTTTAPTTTTTSPTTTTTTEAPAEPTWFDGLEAGLCFDDVIIDGEFDFTPPSNPVDCDSPHDNEIVAIVDLGGGEYHGLDETADAADAACAPEFEAFYGRAITDTDLMMPFSVFPSDADWANGAHVAVCAAYADEKLVGTSASAGLTAPGELLAVLAQEDEITDVWVVAGVDGELLQNVSDDGLINQTSPPSWKADGEVIAYAAGTDDVDRDIYIVSSGGDHAKVVEGVASAGSPAIRPTGNTMAYVAAPDGGEFDIFLVDFDSGTTIKLTDNPDRDTSPNWSPDGTKLAFRGRVDGNSDVYVMDADGSNLTRLTTDPGFDGDPRWSPDGAQLLFTTDRDGDFEIYVMEADGSNQRNLTNHSADDEYPTWSSDGSLIAFHSSRHGGVSVWLMRSDGSDQSALTWLAPTGYPMFSPAP